SIMLVIMTCKDIKSSPVPAIAMPIQKKNTYQPLLTYGSRASVPARKRGALYTNNVLPKTRQCSHDNKGGEAWPISRSVAMHRPVAQHAVNTLVYSIRSIILLTTFTVQN